MAVTYLGNGDTDGTAVEQAGKKVSIFGNSAPVTRPAIAEQALVTSTGVASATAWDCTQLASMKSYMDDINALVSAIQVACVAVDIMKGSA